MKYVIVLGDGMADLPLPSLNHQTPLEAANKPHMDYLSAHGVSGMVQTVPNGMPPGSDTANMSVLGFSPRIYYSGRSPLEAVALGIEVAPEDVTFRTNLVCVSDEPVYADKTMIDYSAGEITTEEADRLIRTLQKEVFTDGDLSLFAGISYRHCLVKRIGETGTLLTPPHDITGKSIKDCLPKGIYGERLFRLMERSYAVLKEHPVNRARIAQGKNPANSVWFWGEGTKPKLQPLEQLYGIKSGMVCAVDLLKGLAICAGMQTVEVPGATGGMITNYKGKAEAALQLLNGDCDLVYIHIEAPDECGHHGDAAAKVAAIEAIDRDVVGYLVQELKKTGEPFRMLLTPDHPTPIALMTHTAEPVPFALYDSEKQQTGPARYTEQQAQATGLFLSEGPQLMQLLLKK